MLISVAKIRQVSEFAKLLAEILSEVAKRRNGSRADFRFSILIFGELAPIPRCPMTMQCGA